MAKMFEVWFIDDHKEKRFYGTFLQDMAERVAKRITKEHKYKVILKET